MGSTTLTRPEGMFFGITAGGQTCFPVFEDYYFAEQARWSGRGLGLSLVQTVQVPERENGEMRTLSLTNEGDFLWEGELVCFWEPVLAEEKDYLAHPAFSKLFLESAFTGDGLVFTRRPRSRREGTPSLAFLWDAPHAGFDTSRETALGRGGLRTLEQAAVSPTQSTAGPVLDPCVLVKIPLALRPGEKRSIHFALAASDSRQGAIQGASALLERGEDEDSRRLERLAAGYGLDRAWSGRAFALLDQLVYGKRPERPWVLWPHGISGDLPVAIARGEREAGKWIGCHQMLTRSGYPFDLIFITEEGGDYRRPVSSRLMEEMKRLGCEHQLGVKGGIHLIEEDAQVLEEAAVRLDEPMPSLPPWREKIPSPVKWEQGIPLWGRGPTGTFVFHTGAKLPPVGWSQILCNGRLGWRTDETGNGHLWLGNAREHALVPWNNDPLAVGGAEQFFLEMDGMEHSLFVDGDSLPCTVTYGPGFARWKKGWGGRSVITTAFVPLEGEERLLLIQTEGNGLVTHRVEGGKEEKFPIEETLLLSTQAKENGGLVTKQVMEGEAWAGKRMNQTVMAWNRMVSALKIHTPDREMDEYMNGWALYQVIACRLLGRTSLYQNGGAFGFRDQLQDVCAILSSCPALARSHILKACGRQYREGDVLHWWHELEDGRVKGVRTRISDDLLWLPYTLWEYVKGTGDREILKEEVPYLVSYPLEEGEGERYEEPGLDGGCGPVLEHARRAVDLVLSRGPGAHGLARMGTGDWNDGMNLVGAEGRGESVWLTWFLALVLDRMADLLGEGEGEPYRQAARAYGQAADACWDGAWYLRGFYDDGST